MVVLKTQELAGIDVVTDGELGRFDVNHPESNGMIDYFVGKMSGVRMQLSRQEEEEFRQQPETSFRLTPAGVVDGPITEGHLNLAADCATARSLTNKPLKFTVTGPHMLAKTLLDRHYRDRQRLAAAIADVLANQVSAVAADVVQVDEANITGHPEEGKWAAAPINRVLRAVKGRKAVHACFGNYAGQTVQKGVWSRLLPFFNALECDHLVLEFARRGYGELEAFRDLRPSIELGVGVIDIKDNQIETAEQVARRIEEATAIVPDRVRWVHPDCGFWMLPRNVVDAKMRALVAGRDKFLGLEKKPVP
jgi:5-methyltetrahydropteroyltriglutamate--homocysteine methyltransferase